jgi:FkbM family methyltransferase
MLLLNLASTEAPGDTDLGTYISLTFPLSDYNQVAVPHLGNFAIRPGDPNTYPLLTASSASYDRYVYNFSASLVRSGTVAIDIGAKSGAYSCGLAQIIGSGGRVYAFEHHLQRYTELLTHVLMNGLENVTCRRAGLSNAAGWVTYPDTDYPSSGGVVLPTGGSGLVQIVLLDTLNLTNVSFMKIDVNGTELEVLGGAVTTITTNLPTVLIIFLNGNTDYTSLPMGNSDKTHIDNCLNWFATRNYSRVYISRSTFLFIPNRS